jgi:hypothetical protein
MVRGVAALMVRGVAAPGLHPVAVRNQDGEVVA